MRRLTRQGKCFPDFAWAQQATIRLCNMIPSLRLDTIQGCPILIGRSSQIGVLRTFTIGGDSAAKRPVYGRRWPASVTASTMLSRRAFSPRWKVSCWIGAHSARVPRRSVPSSSPSRVCTIRIVGIQHWAICSQSTSSSSIPSTRAGLRLQMWNYPLKRGNFRFKSNNSLLI